MKRTVSFDPLLWEQLSAEARERKIGVSTLVGDLLQRELTIARGLHAMADLFAEHGIEPSQEELDEADRRLDEAGVFGDGRIRHMPAPRVRVAPTA